jgi:Phenazine biosynthesis-like protein
MDTSSAYPLLSCFILLQRQFPRASGYPEDPATGIAAAALAVSLHHAERLAPTRFKFYQGTAMGKASLIVVENVQLDIVADDGSDDTHRNSDVDDEDDDVPPPIVNPKKQGTVSFILLGRVEVDDREMIEVDDEEQLYR